MSNGWLEKGAGILRSAGAGWKNFGVVTTRSPWHLAQSKVPSPAQMFLVDGVERRDLRRLAEKARGLDLIIGLGSGVAMDAAKFLAKVTGAPLAQVLSTSSNNACFTARPGPLTTVHASPSGKRQSG
jgi:glycerol dehydrogenase-like iron-containing ADH family enzyme